MTDHPEPANSDSVDTGAEHQPDELRDPPEDLDWIEMEQLRTGDPKSSSD